MCGHSYMTGGTGWQLSVLLRRCLVFMTSQTEISCFLYQICAVLQYRQCAYSVIFFQFQVRNLEITSNLPVLTIRCFPPLFWCCRGRLYILQSQTTVREAHMIQTGNIKAPDTVTHDHNLLVRVCITWDCAASQALYRFFSMRLKKMSLYLDLLLVATFQHLPSVLCHLWKCDRVTVR